MYVRVYPNVICLCIIFPHGVDYYDSISWVLRCWKGSRSCRKEGHMLVQLPAVLHDLLGERQAAVGGVHLVAPLHLRENVLKGYCWIGKSSKGVDFPEMDSETTHPTW